MKKTKLHRIISPLLIASMLTACGLNRVPGANTPEAPAEVTAEATESEVEGSEATENSVPEAPALLSAVSTTLPEAGWQKDVTFPDWKGYVDDTLAMNGMISFKGYHGQGRIYVTPASDVTSFSMYINNREVDTSTMAAGSTWMIDMSDVSLDGTNTLQISRIMPYDEGATVRVCISYPEVIDGSPEEAGISGEALDLISDIIEADVSEGFPGAQLAVIKNGRLVYENAWGYTSAYRSDNDATAASAPVTTDTLYDLASVTKVFSVNYAIQKLLTDGTISLDNKVADYIGERFYTSKLEERYMGDLDAESQIEYRKDLTIRDLMCHQSGFSNDPRYCNPYMDINKPADDPDNANPLYAGNDGSKETKEATIDAICRTPLRYVPGTSTVYSDVNYMLLGAIVEEITGSDLNTWLKKEFWEPMGLKHITYDPLNNGFSASDCAATEPYGNTRDGYVSFPGIRTETIQGQVHDELSYYSMNGISGHAGLFASASDLARLASVMLTGGYGENRFFSRNVIDSVASPKKENATNWGTGWYREGEDQRVWYFGTQSSPDTIGHQGWTGTMVMIDPSRDLVVAYLTNKINSPVTEPEENLNKFEGGSYTSATLGFVPQILSIGMEGGDVTAPLSELAADMAVEASKLLKDDVWVEHPLVKNLRARISVLRKWADRSDKGKDDRLSLADSLSGDVFYLNKPDETVIESVLAGMDTKQKITQMLMPNVRYWGEDDDKEGITVLNDELTQMFKKYSFGGVVLFAQNCENAAQTKAFTSSLQQANAEGSAKTKLLISIDQEGGGVTRLSTGTQLPGNMALAATNDTANARKSAEITGQELKALGINADFAPVLDVNSNPSNPVIGIRSFSDDALTVRKFGKACQSGLHSMGVITALKHFPGHGNTDTDSHTGLPMIDRSEEELMAEELLPFIGNLRRADMVMTAHIQYPQIEQDVYVSKSTGEEITLPATLSDDIITGILRKKLGYSGVVVTDAMDMDAISEHFDPVDAALLAINAGADMILMPVEVRSDKGLKAMDDYIDSLVKLVDDGKIKTQTIDAAVTRILDLKYRYGLLTVQDTPAADAPDISVVGSAAHHDEEWDMAKRAVTLLKNDDNLLPLSGSEHVLIACPYDSELNSCEYALDLLKKDGALPSDADVKIISYSKLTTDDAKEALGEADTVIAISAVYSAEEMDPSDEKGTGSAFLDKLMSLTHRAGGHFILLSVQLPYDTARYEKADAIIACYNARGMSEKPEANTSDQPQYGPNVPAAVYTIFGGSSPSGKLPVNIPKYDTKSGTYKDELVYERGFGLKYE